MFRIRPNDSFSARVIAEHGVNGLGKKKWAIIHSTDAFGTSGAKALTESLAKGGATVALDQGYTNQSQDFTPVVLAIRQSGADVIGSYFTFENDIGIFARQLRQLGVTAPWVGSPSITNVTALKLAGPSLYGTYGVADYAEESSDAARAFGKAYRAAMKVAPDNQSSWTFDAVTVLAKAINTAGKTDPQAVREAILAVRGHEGAEGSYNFDKNGDGLHGYNVVRNDKGNIVFDRRIDFYTCRRSRPRSAFITTTDPVDLPASDIQSLRGISLTWRSERLCAGNVRQRPSCECIDEIHQGRDHGRRVIDD